MIVRRSLMGAQVRAASTDDKPGIEGYAAVFNQEYVLWDSASLRIVERVKPGTFSRTLSEKQDVRCCFNHNADNVLGRTGNGTMQLRQDDHGLFFHTDLDGRTSIAQNVRCFVDRGDVKGCSFSFMVTKQTRTEEEVDGKTVITRDIEDVDTFELGPVLFPAYEGTDVKARAVELRSWLTPGQMEKLRAAEHECEIETGSVDEKIARAIDAATPRIVQRAVAEARELKNKRDGAGCECKCRACSDGNCAGCPDDMNECGDADNCACQRSKPISFDQAKARTHSLKLSL